MVLVGLEPGSNTYRLWDKSTRRIIISSDVKFDEEQFPATGHISNPSSSQIEDNFSDIMATVPIDEIDTSPVMEDLPTSTT